MAYLELRADSSLALGKIRRDGHLSRLLHEAYHAGSRENVQRARAYEFCGVAAVNDGLDLAFYSDFHKIFSLVNKI